MSIERVPKNAITRRARARLRVGCGGVAEGMAAVAAVAFGRPEISFLWHNVVGATVVFLVGLALSLVAPAKERAAEP